MEKAMTGTERKEERKAAGAQTRPQGQPVPSDEPAVRRPEEDIAHRPVLKVRPMGSRAAAEPPKPAPRRGAMPSAQDRPEEVKPAVPKQPVPVVAEPVPLKKVEAAAEPPPAKRAEAPVAPVAPKKVELTAQEETGTRYPYATYRSAPPDEKAEKRELAALTGAKAEREISTGLVLGLALIVLALLCGVFIVGLGKRVRALERRVSRLEGVRLQNTVSRPRMQSPTLRPSSGSGMPRRAAAPTRAR